MSAVYVWEYTRVKYCNNELPFKDSGLKESKLTKLTQVLIQIDFNVNLEGSFYKSWDSEAVMLGLPKHQNISCEEREYWGALRTELYGL